MKESETWLATGSQHLCGPQTLGPTAGIECLCIDECTRIRDLLNALRWKEAAYSLARSR